jgi:GT2 family glycosyltransferase
MSRPTVSVIIPTHNRPDRLPGTLAALASQDLPGADYEVIVVDDGSSPAVQLPECGFPCTLVRLEGVERSAARNAGAAAAHGDLLVFIDDDIAVRPGFLAAHYQAHREWPDALLVGEIRLPDEALRLPFPRFRQRLENREAPQAAGLTSQPNFCAAGNVAIPRRRFETLGGFDPGLSSGEDQDLALRHTSAGGRIAFVPAAGSVHHDSALDVRSYCRRVEWGSEAMIPFCLRYHDWPDNVERARVNGPTRWGAESPALSLRKLVKSALALPVVTACLFRVAALLERRAPVSRLLDRVYRLLLGVHILRGYRRGLKRYGPGGPPVSPAGCPSRGSVGANESFQPTEV